MFAIGLNRLAALGGKRTLGCPSHRHFDNQLGLRPTRISMGCDRHGGDWRDFAGAFEAICLNCKAPSHAHNAVREALRRCRPTPASIFMIARPARHY
jgi:hypothetical protein